MKTLIVRLSVLTLAASGFAASTMISQAAPATQKIQPVVVSGVGCPPMCMPRDPSHCGMD